MKSIVTLASLMIALSANAFQTGWGNNGPWTVGPLGYTDPFVSSQGTAVTSAGSLAGSSVGNPTIGSSVGTSASLQMKAIAIRVTNDALEYLQNGEMSVLLASYVQKIEEQNSEISETEAVQIVLEFADKHI